MADENIKTEPEPELPHVAQVTFTRDMAHYLCTLISIGQAIHDNDEERWNRRSQLLQVMLWEGIGPPGPPLDHGAFHRLADASLDVLKATDPAAYEEAFGDKRTPNELRKEQGPDSVLNLLEHLIGKGVKVYKLDPKAGPEPDAGPSGKRGPAKKARKRRRKDGT